MSENGNSPVVVESPAVPETAAAKTPSAEAATEPAEVASATDVPAESGESTEETPSPAVAPDTVAGASSDTVAGASSDTVAEASSDTVAEASSETAAQAADDADHAAVAEGAGESAEAAEAPGAARPPRAKKPAKKRPRRPGARSEEYVAPTPEDLAGIPSEIVRQAVELGHPVEGKVIGWNQGGFHVVVEGITSFCPRSSMELGAPHEPAHYLDQTYVFRVLRVEEKGHRLILSRAAMLREERRRQAEETRAALEVGMVVDGRVVALTDFGAFVDLGGVEGLIHVSEIRHGRVTHPGEVLHVGQPVQAKVIKLGKGHERVSLSMRALEPDPWQDAAKWAAGGRFSGTVLRKSDFGWFVELAPGVEGLLHPSQLKSGMKAEDAELQPGATIEGWVRELDPIRKRVSLSLRETPSGNPWEGVDKKYAEGATVIGTVEKLAPFGAFIVLEPGLTGLLPTSEMGLPRGANVGKAYPVGKKVTLQIAQVDVRRKRISLTLEGKTLEGSRSDYQNYVKKTRRDTGMGALAAAFDRLKTQP